MIWKVVELSKPVDISSISSTFVGPTIISPVVTRFFCPPEIPRCISSPTMVSLHMSSPSICKYFKSQGYFVKEILKLVNLAIFTLSV